MIKLTWMYQFLFRSEWRLSLSVISAAVIAFGRSCLLAKTRRIASRSSSSAYASLLRSYHDDESSGLRTSACIRLSRARPDTGTGGLLRLSVHPHQCPRVKTQFNFRTSIRASSSRASPTRSRSLLSTTKMRPYTLTVRPERTSLCVRQGIARL